MMNTETATEASGTASERPFHEDIEVGDLTVTTYVHNDGTVSVSFTKYSTPAGRYSSTGFQFTAADLTAIVALFNKTVTATEAL